MKETMPHLPIDVLADCLQYLDHRDLCTLSLVDRQWRYLSLPAKLRTLKLRFSSPEDLSSAIARCNEFLNTLASAKRHVHDLWIVAANLYQLEETVDFAHFGNDGARPLEPWKYTAVSGFGTVTIAPDAPQWQELSDFIESLPTVRNLVWACSEQIPSHIYRHVGSRVPQCRLDMRNFRLRSLILPRGQEINISAGDLEIATAPCLHSISSLEYDGGYSDFGRDAVFEMAAGAAPSLRKVHQSWHQMGATPYAVQAWRTPALKWRPGIVKLPSSRGSLDTLVLEGLYARHALIKWNKYTDFSVLRVLKVYDELEVDDFEWMMANCRFPSLEELAIKHKTPHLTADTFILSLPPLTSLELYNSRDASSLDTILRHCGRRLRSLHCKNITLTGDLVKRLASSCPHIETIGLNMLRQAGSAAEVAIYHGLGKLPALQKLYLSISSPRPVANLGLDSTTDEVAFALRNLAIDGALARLIFQAITSTKARYARPLECLQLRMAGREIGFDLSNLTKLLRHIASSWVCTRNTRDDSTPQDCLVEPGSAKEKRLHAHADRKWLDGVLEGHHASTVLSVWPESCNGNLADHWHSFPLSKSDTVTSCTQDDALNHE